MGEQKKKSEGREGVGYKRKENKKDTRGRKKRKATRYGFEMTRSQEGTKNG